MASTRAAFLQRVFHDVDKHDTAIQEALQPSAGADTPDLLQKAKLANSLGDLTENAGLVR